MSVHDGRSLVRIESARLLRWLGAHPVKPEHAIGTLTLYTPFQVLHWPIVRLDAPTIENEKFRKR